MTKTEVKRVLKNATRCAIQHTGYPCGTCFFSISDKLDNQDWQALLLFRGDYEKEELDNLPNSVENALEKIMSIARSQ